MSNYLHNNLILIHTYCKVSRKIHSRSVLIYLFLLLEQTLIKCHSDMQIETCVLQQPGANVSHLLLKMGTGVSGNLMLNCVKCLNSHMLPS